MLAFQFEGDILSLEFKSHSIIALQTWLLKFVQFLNRNILCAWEDQVTQVTLVAYVYSRDAKVLQCEANDI